MPGTYHIDLEIKKRALQILGANQIISSSDKTQTAEQISLSYRGVRDAFIRNYNWGCCIKEDTIPLMRIIENEPLKYVYALPSDYLNLIKINEFVAGFSHLEYNTQSYLPFKIRGKELFCSFKPPLKIEYSFRNETVSDYDPSFCECLAVKLAMAICEKETGSDSKYQKLTAIFKEELRLALKANAIELPPVIPVSGNWDVSRSFY